MTAPTVDESLALIAKQLLELNQRLSLINGWMEGQEKVSADHLGHIKELRRAMDAARGEALEVRDTGERTAARVTELSDQMQGVLELSKSTYDIVAELKHEHMGGDDGAKSDQKQATR